MTHDDETIERVARAIWDVEAPEHRMEWDEETSAGKERYLCIARAALSAMPGRELPPDSIPMPRNMGEARAMVLMGERMLRAGKIKEPGHEMLRETLEWIATNYANQDISHMDFRVEAYARTLAAISKAQGSSK